MSTSLQVWWHPPQFYLNYICVTGSGKQRTRGRGWGDWWRGVIVQAALSMDFHLYNVFLFLFWDCLIIKPLSIQVLYFLPIYATQQFPATWKFLALLSCDLNKPGMLWYHLRAHVSMRSIKYTGAHAYLSNTNKITFETHIFIIVSGGWKRDYITENIMKLN